MVIVSAIVATIVSCACIFVYDVLDQIREKNAPKNNLKKAVKELAASFNPDSIPVAIGSNEYFFLVLDEKLEKSIVYGDASAVTENIMIADVEKGKMPQVITTANIPIEKILEKLDKKGEVWLSYQVHNQEISKGQSGELYLFKGKDHIFGGGFYYR